MKLCKECRDEIIKRIDEIKEEYRNRLAPFKETRTNKVFPDEMKLLDKVKELLK